ncbi:hypothetical protein L6452_14150 [Arctium lappa]|uniref:Uncharacterized protein n=1 Tax=Arctium lappa TaxID=4217 RepID=A0ACB9CKG0_ARCLA|nr:hypothetical protein L6452_14150 [Arctium lappa]
MGKGAVVDGMHPSGEWRNKCESSRGNDKQAIKITLTGTISIWRSTTTTTKKQLKYLSLSSSLSFHVN